MELQVLLIFKNLIMLKSRVTEPKQIGLGTQWISQPKHHQHHVSVIFSSVVKAPKRDNNELHKG